MQRNRKGSSAANKIALMEEEERLKREEEAQKKAKEEAKLKEELNSTQKSLGNKINPKTLKSQEAERIK